MKKFIYTTIVVFILAYTYVCKAEEKKNKSFLTQSLAWVDGFGYEQDGKYKTDDVKMFFYKAAGDTLISNKRYVRIRRAMKCKTSYKREEDAEGNGYISDKRLIVQDDTLCFFLREDGAGDVWLYTEDKNVFREVSHNSLYEYMADNLVGRDLSLFNPTKRYAMGDSLLLGMSALVDPNGFGGGEDFWHIYSSPVKKVNEINLSDGKTYPIYNKYFVESIGPLDGPLSGIGSPNSYSLDFRQLFAFYRDGQMIYKNDGYLAALEECFPNILDSLIGTDLSTDPVTFTFGQMATIILPTEPDASKGKYYRLDRVEGNEIVFEQELLPRARVPYIIVPYEDFSIGPGTLDLEGCRPDTASISGIRFIGTYCREELPALSVGTGGGFQYIDIIDTTPDCREDAEASVVGALRAYLEVDPSALNWDDPYHPGGTKSPRKEEEKMPVVLKDSGTSIHGVRDEMANSKLPDSIFYDLSGRRIVNSKSSNGKLSRGVYIKDGKKLMR